MASFYTYLISSLPMLHFGAKPPFSFEKFLEICRDKIPDEEIVLLKITSHKKWHSFDTALRNELVKIRAQRKHIDPLKYIRGDSYTEPSIAHIAMNAYRNTSILEAEKMLEQARWQMLDELAVGHYFDLDVLIIYALKLLILERWERIRSSDKSQLLEGVLS